MAGYAGAALAHLAFLAYLVRRGFLGVGRDASSKVFAGAIVASAAWAGANAAVHAGWLDPRWPIAIDLLRYAAWFGFLLLSIAPATQNGRSRLFQSLAGVAVVLFAWGVLANVGQLGIPWRHVDLPAGNLLAMGSFGLVLLEQLFRNQGDATRWNAKPVCLALGFVFVFDLYCSSEAVLLGGFDDSTLAIRGVVHAMAIPLLALATRRDDRWVGKIQVSRSAAFYSAAVLLVGTYLLFVSGVGYYVRYFGGSWGRALQLALLFAALLILAAIVVSGTVRSTLRVYLGKNFFSYRYDYREEWLRFTGRLSSTSGPQDVGSQVVRGLADMVECPAGSLWSRDFDGDAFVQSACWNVPPSAEREPVASAFCSYMLEREWIIDFDEFRASPRHYGGLIVPVWLATNPAVWLAVPLIVGAELTGFVVLARPRADVELNWEVRDLLKTAARQAAGFLAQMRATEALLEARKFDAFNRMSAFVVHDLKNIITQLSLMLKNAQRHGHNPEFQQDMLLTVESSLEKMRQLMVQLREGEKPASGAASGVDLPLILARMEALARSRGRSIEVRILDRLSTRGHEQRLERVIGHVVQNALEATPESGTVWIELRQVSGRVSVTVGDTGVGMSQEFIQTRLFRPFSSTKHSGMGIGTYESFQYIKELGGTIQVASQPGEGTVVTLLLPLFEHRARSDLQMTSPT